MASEARSLKIYMLLLLTFLFFSCEHNDTVRLLENSWVYSTEGQNDEYNSFDLSRIKELSQFFPDHEGIIYLKTEFYLPESYKDQILSVFLGRIEIADKTYLNGQLIGETGSFPPGWYNDWNMDRRYDIPPSLVNWGGSNKLLLKVYVNRAGLIDGDIRIGPKPAIERVFSFNCLIHRYINILFSFLLLFFSVNSLLLYSRRKQDRQIFWFALVSITFALSQAGIFLSSMPGFEYSRVSYIPFMKIIGILEILVACFFFLFTRCFFPKKNNSRLWMLFFLPSAVLTIAYMLQVDYKPFYLFYNYFEISLSLPSVYIISLVIRAGIEKRKGAKLFLTALIPASLLILHDMILTNVIEGYILMLTGISLPLLLIIINMVYGLELVRDRNKAEVLNIELDQTINRHMDELKDASEKLSHSSRRERFISSFSLSVRERQILGLIIDGLSNDEIANKLELSIRTVSAHIYKIYRKIDLHSRTEIFAAFNKNQEL